MYSAADVRTRAGITYRQLDEWVRRGYVPLDNPTPGSGKPRQFSQEALDAVIQIANVKRQLAALKAGAE